MNLRIGSLFSGIGGLELGLERAGLGQVAWQCESNPYCRRVLEKHWPGVPKFEDIKALYRPPACEVLCGGFPCQDVSKGNATGAGIHGERSGLFFELMRIVCVVRPRLVVMENVPALTSRGLGVVLGSLAEAGLDAEWGCLSAAGVGAPHLRRRIFILAYPDNEPDPTARGQREAAAGEGLGWRDDRIRSDGDAWGQGPIRGPGGHPGVQAQTEKMAEPSGEGLQIPKQTALFREGRREEGRATTECGWWDVEPSMGRVADGVPRRVDRLRALGNAVVPEVAEKVGRMAVALMESQR